MEVRAPAASFGLVLTLLLPIASAEAAHADPIGHCSTTVGTIVAVDFGHWGGPVVRGCGVNDASGYALLHAGGFTTAGDSHDGPAFVCRLGNQAFDSGTQYPTPEQDPCVRTPPASSDWSYWLAAAGHDKWSYSPLGPMSEKPKPGEVELWTYGGTNIAGTSGSGVPTFSPDALRARNIQPAAKATPSTSPTRRPSPKASHGASSPGHSPSSPASDNGTAPASTASGDRASPTASAPGHRAGGRGKPTPRPSAAQTATAAARGAGGQTGSDPKIVDAQPAAASHASNGSALPLLIVLGLIAILGGAAGWTVWRRRQQEQ
jgi:hypothetical protein